MSIDWGIEELACAACGKSEDETDEIINNSEVDDILHEKYGVDFEMYCAIVKDLLPMTPTVKAALSGTEYHAFVRGNGMLVKMPAT